MNFDKELLTRLFCLPTKQIFNTLNGFTRQSMYSYRIGTLPILLVAHADTVHDTLPTESNLCWGQDVVTAPITGLGADDRAGIYIISQIVQSLDCSILITDGEERGGLGARQFVFDKVSIPCNAIIEFDRRHSKDAVFYDCSNRDFMDVVCADYFELDHGSFSDISTIAPFLDTAAVNLSCGYYNEHTNNEYLILSEMLKVIDEGIKCINRIIKADKHFEFDSYLSPFESEDDYLSDCEGEDHYYWDSYEGFYRRKLQSYIW